jgi:hypothetical protein
MMIGSTHPCRSALLICSHPSQLAAAHNTDATIMTTACRLVTGTTLGVNTEQHMLHEHLVLAVVNRQNPNDDDEPWLGLLPGYWWYVKHNDAVTTLCEGCTLENARWQAMELVWACNCVQSLVG